MCLALIVGCHCGMLNELGYRQIIFPNFPRFLLSFLTLHTIGTINFVVTFTITSPADFLILLILVHGKCQLPGVYFSLPSWRLWFRDRARAS